MSASKSGTPCLSSGDTAIFILMHNLVASLCCQLSKIVKLTLDMLIGGRNTDIKRDFFHFPRFSFVLIPEGEDRAIGRTVTSRWRKP